MVRGKLQIPPAKASKEELQAAWRAMDADASGYVSAGEFGAFMRKGQGDEAAAAGPSTAWKTKLVQQRLAGAKAVRTQLDEMVGRDLNKKMIDIVAASDDEVNATRRASSSGPLGFPPPATPVRSHHPSRPLPAAARRHHDPARRSHQTIAHRSLRAAAALTAGETTIGAAECQARGAIRRPAGSLVVQDVPRR